jgi:hypothetical protein
MAHLGNQGAVDGRNSGALSGRCYYTVLNFNAPNQHHEEASSLPVNELHAFSNGSDSIELRPNDIHPTSMAGLVKLVNVKNIKEGERIVKASFLMPEVTLVGWLHAANKASCSVSAGLL